MTPVGSGPSCTASSGAHHTGTPPDFIACFRYQIAFLMSSISALRWWVASSAFMRSTMSGKWAATLSGRAGRGGDTFFPARDMYLSALPMSTATMPVIFAVHAAMTLIAS